MVEVLKDHSVDYRTLKYHKCSFEEKTVTGMCLLLWQIYSTKRKIAIPGHGSRQKRPEQGATHLSAAVEP